MIFEKFITEWFACVKVDYAGSNKLIVICKGGFQSHKMADDFLKLNYYELDTKILPTCKFMPDSLKVTKLLRAYDKLNTYIIIE
jgi:hypothetical protein